jgi:predicted SprT family Zn-dependent metalloprotease
MKTIALKELPRAFSPGTGNKSSRVRRDDMIALNDINIGQYDFNAFIKMINKEHFNKDIDIDIILSNRQCKNRWGTAYLIRKKVLLYRHSVWVFLHEIAHVYTHHTNPPDLGRRRRAHGIRFGKMLNKIYILWTNYSHNYKFENVAFTYDEKIANKPEKKVKIKRLYAKVIIKCTRGYLYHGTKFLFTHDITKAHVWTQQSKILEYTRRISMRYNETAELISAN